MSDYLVVGAGPAGLATALALARSGRSVEVVEQADRVGGLAASIEVGGMRVDLGSHRLHPSAPPHVAALLDGLLGNDLQRRERNGRLRLGDRWVRFPFRPADLVRSLPPALAVRLAAELATAGTPDDAQASTYAEFVSAGLGPTTLAEFHGPMAAKLWGRPAEELSAELARRRISVRDRRSLARRLARTARASGREFRYPRLGYGQIVERMADAAVAAGATISLSATVTALTPGDEPTVTIGHRAPTLVERVVWTAPPWSLAAAVGNSNGATGIEQVEHRGLVLVYLVLPTDRFTPFDAHYIADPAVAAARLSEPKNYRDGPDPVGSTVLCAELPASVGDEVWTAADADLVARVVDDLGRLGLAHRDVPIRHVDAHVVRLPAVYPVLRAGHEREREAAIAQVDRLAGVTLLGRPGRVVADNLHHVVDMGLTAAACCQVPTGWDDTRWRREVDRFESFVVDD